MTNAFLIIDMQNDFVKPKGALSVKGADADIKKLTDFINKTDVENIDYIVVTLDSHHVMHIANCDFWNDKDGKKVEPFTIIHREDIKNGTYVPIENKSWALTYTRELENAGKELKVWPLHCIIGSDGASLHKDLVNCLINWEKKTHKQYQLVYKGYNKYTEHYSVLKGEVEIDNCHETLLNKTLINDLNKFDRIFIAGEAANVCVLNTIKDFIIYAPKMLNKFVILKDCMSPIGEWDIDKDEVFNKAVSLGAEIMNTTDVEF